MHADTDKDTLSPTLTRVLNIMKERELEKAVEEANIKIAKKLMKEGFKDEKIAELTELSLEDVLEIRKSLQG